MTQYYQSAAADSFAVVVLDIKILNLISRQDQLVKVEVGSYTHWLIGQNT